MVKYFNHKKVLFLFLISNFGSDLVSASVGRRYFEVYDSLVCAVLDDDVSKAREELERGTYDLSKKYTFGRTLRHFAHSPEMDHLLISHGIATDEKKPTLSISAEIYAYFNGDEEKVSRIYGYYNLNPDHFNLFCRYFAGLKHKASYRACRKVISLNESIKAAEERKTLYERLLSAAPTGSPNIEKYKIGLKEADISIEQLKKLQKEQADIARAKDTSARKFDELSEAFSWKMMYDPRSLDAKGFTPGQYTLEERMKIARNTRESYFVKPVSETLS